jgi:hypothetical protein
MARLMPTLIQPFFDADGNPLAGGKVYTYEAGTTTPLVTYNSATESVPTQNTNPVILDANGNANIWLKNQSYKIVVKDSDDNTLITRDNVTHIGTGEIITALIADDAVTTVKILNEAVTTAKIDDEAVTTQKIAPDAVTGSKILEESIDSDHYADGSIDREHLAADIVNGTKIADDSIDSEHYADGSIDTAHIANGQVTPVKQSTYYSLVSLAADSWAFATPKTLGSLVVTGRPVRVTIYEGQIGATTETGIFNLNLEYSSDNSSWNAVTTLAKLQGAISPDVSRYIFGGESSSAMNDSGNHPLGALSSIHSAPTAGTAYYRLDLASVTGTPPTVSIATELKILIEEL